MAYLTLRQSARQGRRLRGGGLRHALILLTTLAAAGWATAAASTPVASGAVGGGSASGGTGPGSGGASPGSSSPASPSTPPSAPRAPAHSPLDGRGMWIWYVARSSGGDLSAIASTARTYGLSTVIIKAGDGSVAWGQFNSTLVAELHAARLRACAWQYVYGMHPIFEAEVGAAAVRQGADCLVIDAESEYEGRYVQAQEYMKKLRQLIGAHLPVALAGFPYVDYHPGFPYSVFLGPGGAQYNVPQMYWRDIGTSVDDIYSHTYSYNLPYQRPIEPLGEVAGNPPPGQVIRFRQLSRAYGAGGVSWWDWQESTLREWKALGQAAPNLAHYASQAVLPSLTLKAVGGIWAGDLVVWAQEHLYRAGLRLKIDGRYGAQSQLAVEQFQTAHGLPVTGIVDPDTWQALLRYPPASVTWATRKGKKVAYASRSGLMLTPPTSARLPARRDEIPRDLGAGTGPGRGRF